MKTPGEPENSHTPLNRTISIIEESATFATREEDAGKLTVDKAVVEVEEVIKGTFERQRYSIQRIPKNERVASGYQSVRHEGDTIIISVVEERVLVEKAMYLIEEIHLSRKTEQLDFEEPVRLKKEIVTVARESNNDNIH